jgi:hypothetical protein
MCINWPCWFQCTTRQAQLLLRPQPSPDPPPRTLSLRYTDSAALDDAAKALGPGGVLYTPFNIALIFFFNYYYTFLQVGASGRRGAGPQPTCTHHMPACASCPHASFPLP